MSPYLPKGFEKLLKVKMYRDAAIKCIQSHGENPEDYGLTKKCRKSNRCGSGLCPICVRLIRKKFMHFADKNGFFERDWFFITIRFDIWRMADGDLQSFAEFAGVKTLTDIPQIKNLLQRFRREHATSAATDDLIVIGSVETIIRTVKNKPDGKPFHFHLMVTGLTKAQVDKCCRKTKQLPEAIASDYPRPVDIKTVSGIEDAIKALSYAIKQPFWKYSYYGEGKHDREKQFPNKDELYQLIRNYGPHRCTDRWFKLGFEYRGDKFLLSKMKSKFDLKNSKQSASLVADLKVLSAQQDGAIMNDWIMAFSELNKNKIERIYNQCCDREQYKYYWTKRKRGDELFDQVANNLDRLWFTARLLNKVNQLPVSLKHVAKCLRTVDEQNRQIITGHGDPLQRNIRREILKLIKNEKLFPKIKIGQSVKAKSKTAIGFIRNENGKNCLYIQPEELYSKFPDNQQKIIKGCVISLINRGYGKKPKDGFTAAIKQEGFEPKGKKNARHRCWVLYLNDNRTPEKRQTD